MKLYTENVKKCTTAETVARQLEIWGGTNRFIALLYTRPAPHV